MSSPHMDASYLRWYSIATVYTCVCVYSYSYFASLAFIIITCMIMSYDIATVDPH